MHCSLLYDPQDREAPTPHLQSRIRRRKDSSNRYGPGWTTEQLEQLERLDAVAEIVVDHAGGCTQFKK